MQCCFLKLVSKCLLRSCRSLFDGTVRQVLRGVAVALRECEELRKSVSRMASLVGSREARYKLGIESGFETGKGLIGQTATVTLLEIEKE